MKEILPYVCEGKNVLVAAHGNSLRSLIKFLDNISDEDIVKLEIPTGAPIHYVTVSYTHLTLPTSVTV